MAFYRKSSQRLIFETFRTLKPKPPSFSPSPPKPLFRTNFPPSPQNPYLTFPKRYYYTDRNQVKHFKKRGYIPFLQNPRNIFIVVLLSSGITITLYFGNLETVPYSKRTHFVLLSRNLEISLGEKEFKKIKEQYKSKVLPPLHPESIRVQRISSEIIEALGRGLRKDTEQVWVDGSGFKSNESEFDDRGTEKWGSGDVEGDKWGKEDEIVDDQWVQKSRDKGREVSSQTRHLEGLKWEVLVVNDPMINAFCLPGGKIVVFTGLLNHFRADAEVATVISHEVGHAVARHSAEQISKNLWLTILQLILYQFFMPDIVNTMSNLLLRLPFSRRMETEADYIGLLLVASAGYDPRVAPQVYEKLGKVAGDSALQDYLATHPSGKKRAQLLAQAEVMKEAFDIYREVQAGRGIEGFL